MCKVVSIYTISPGRALQGIADIPGDKSISHRAIILGSIACGTTVIDNFLASDDCLANLEVCKSLGVEYQKHHSHRIQIEGRGLYGLKAPKNQLDFANAGTAIRLWAGILVAQSFSSCLTGDVSLKKRPMQRIIAPLSLMGANIEGEKNLAPLNISPVKALNAINYSLPIASAQVKSCVMLASLYTKGESVLTEKQKTRDHTERLLQAFGYPLHVQDKQIKLTGGHQLQARHIVIPKDFSSAAFFIVAALIKPGSHLYLKDININPTRIGALNCLREMGAKIFLNNQRMMGAEPVADVEVIASSLVGKTFSSNCVASAIDEFPILFVAAVFAQGRTIFKGLQELRHKESDRIATMVDGLTRLGAKISAHGDDVIVDGTVSLAGAVRVDSHFDHRIAMALAVAGSNARYPIEIKNCHYIDTSFPGFKVLANQLGMCIEE